MEVSSNLVLDLLNTLLTSLMTKAFLMQIKKSKIKKNIYEIWNYLPFFIVWEILKFLQKVYENGKWGHQPILWLCQSNELVYYLNRCTARMCELLSVFFLICGQHTSDFFYSAFLFVFFYLMTIIDPTQLFFSKVDKLRKMSTWGNKH